VSAVIGVARAKPARRLGGDVVVALAGFFVAITCVCAVFGALIAPYSPNAEDLLHVLAAPSSQHLLGTDQLGRDVLSRVIIGARTAVIGPSLVALMSFLLGGALGLAAGFAGPRTDSIISRAVDVLFAIPAVLIAAVVIGVLGGGYYIAVAIVVLAYLPYDMRTVRGVVIEQRSLPYVEAATLLGLSRRQIALRHVWPNVLPFAAASACATFAFSLVTLASLSFLGLGAGPASADWGRQLADSQEYLISNPVTAFVPAAMIVLLAASMNTLGDWLLDRLLRKGGR
jgi:peptide/nickel transport system permease protein